MFSCYEHSDLAVCPVENISTLTQEEAVRYRSSSMEVERRFDVFFFEESTICWPMKFERVAWSCVYKVVLNAASIGKSRTNSEPTVSYSFPDCTIFSNGAAIEIKSSYDVNGIEKNTSFFIHRPLQLQTNSVGLPSVSFGCQPRQL